MIFEVNFNRESDDKTIELIGAKLVYLGYQKYPPVDVYKLEINNFEELQSLLSKLDELKFDLYSAVISFDPPTIFFDKDV